MNSLVNGFKKNQTSRTLISARSYSGARMIELFPFSLHNVNDPTRHWLDRSNTENMK